MAMAKHSHHAIQLQIKDYKCARVRLFSWERNVSHSSLSFIIQNTVNEHNWSRTNILTRKVIQEKPAEKTQTELIITPGNRMVLKSFWRCLCHSFTALKLWQRLVTNIIASFPIVMFSIQQNTLFTTKVLLRRGPIPFQGQQFSLVFL